MNKLSAFTIIFLVAISGAMAQYSNHWIDYGQEYYKIPVSETGVYRISYTSLQNVGFPVNTIDPRWIRIYHRGEEIAIRVVGQQDASFDNSDYVEFYGEKNDGTLDESLYLEAGFQSHKYYNIYSDETAYFLTYTVGSNGKRVTKYQSNNVDALPAETYYLDEHLAVFTDQYANGRDNYASEHYVEYTGFDQGEGWSGIARQEGQSVDYTITNIVGFGTGDNPSIEVQILGRDDWGHQVNILVGPNASSLRSIGTATFADYETYALSAALEWSDISNEGQLVVRCMVEGVSGENDLASLNYVKLSVPRPWDFIGIQNKFITTKVSSEGKSYLEIENAPSNVVVYDVTDPYNIREIGFNANGALITAMLNNTEVERKLYMATSSATPTIKKVNFTDYNLSAYNYIIISHAQLMQSGGSYANPVQVYVDYRSSEAGGGYQAMAIDIEELFNQYNYGEYSPLAIYDFVKRWHNEGSPEGLFIIGKALLPGLKSGNYYYRKNPEQFAFKDLVPTAGRPGSDLLYGMGLAGDPSHIEIPVGRITASTPAQVAAYLDKVIELENSNTTGLWKKNILHLSGGLTESELTRFANHLAGFEATAEDLYLGADVTTIRKQSPSNLEFINTTDVINSGLGMITFFGHSAPNIVDIDIGYVSDPIHGYENTGMYPLLFVNGCHSGQVFGNNFLWTEDWALTAGLGSIGSIAHSNYGYENNLRNYTNLFYEVGFADSSMIYKPLGAKLKKTLNEYRDMYGNSSAVATQSEQMLLLADPMLRTFVADKPDYRIDDNNTYLEAFAGGNIDALVDSFAISAIVENYGRADGDSILVRVERTLDDNTVLFYDAGFPAVYYQDTLAITIYNDEKTYAGRNVFKFIIDQSNEIAELDESNNTATITANLTLNGTKNLLPTNFGVVNSTSTNLIIQSANVLGQQPRKYTIELDTLNSFNSSYLQTFEVEATNLLVQNVQLLGTDSLVYYWRTRFSEPQPGENEDWVTNSFTYISNGNSGWSQSHRQQKSNNTYSNINFNEQTGAFSFVETNIPVELQVFGANHPTKNYADVHFTIDGLAYIYESEEGSRLCRNDAINLVAFSKETALPYIGIPFPFWVANACGRQSRVINNFQFSQIINSGKESTTNTDNYLEQYIDRINDGDFVLVFTTGNIQFQNWTPEMRQQLERIGASSATLALLGEGEPLIVYGKMGASPGTALEITATEIPYNKQVLELNKLIEGVEQSGNIWSTVIGPAASWQTFKNSVEASPVDEQDYSFEVTPLTLSKQPGEVLSDIETEELDLSQIDASVFPYLQLKMNLSDSANLTASQLKFWQVEYEALPEGVLLLGDNEQGYELEKQEGEKFATAMRFTNVSGTAFRSDSLTVVQTDVTQGTRARDVQSFKIKAPLPGDTTHFNLETATINKLGINDFSLFVNEYETPELYYDNNSILLPAYFSVFADSFNPILQVLFDGKTIANGDVVSANPTIEITVWDENPYLSRNDTTGVNIFLKESCEQCDFRRIAFSSGQLVGQFDDLQNKTDITYTPGMLTDGIYTLRVDGSDATGNKSGTEAYEIQFEVVNASSVIEFGIYPNPATRKAIINYTLTGSEQPDRIQLEIMNLNGKTVRLITHHQMQSTVGENRIAYEWDLTDNAGKVLPQGVYLYKFAVWLNGTQLVGNESSSSGNFRNGIGRILIIR